ncbi:MAG: MFS transporter [Actinomycetota bacterium]
MRGNRDFRRVYVASLISLGGDWFLTVALFSLVLRFTGSPIAVALVIGVQDLAFFLGSPLAGALVDRMDRRQLMIVTDVVRGVLCFGFLFVRSDQSVWVVYALLTGIAFFSAVFEPASAATLPNLVEREDLATANALSGSTWGTMLAVGAALGGLVSGVFGTNTAIVVDAVSFFASAMMVVGVHRSFAEAGSEALEHAGILEATRETVGYARRDHRVLALIAVKFGWGLAGGVLVLIPLLAKGPFHGGDVAVGMLMAFRGVGALIGPFAARRALGANDRRLFLVIGIALAVFGIGYALVGLVPSLLLAMPVIALAHVGGGAQWMLSSYGLQKIVPDRIRGRIFAFDGMLVTLTFGTSSVLTGFIAEAIGPRETAWLLGAIAVVWALVWSWLTGDVRRATLADGCVPAVGALESG